MKGVENYKLLILIATMAIIGLPIVGAISMNFQPTAYTAYQPINVIAPLILNNSYILSCPTCGSGGSGTPALPYNSIQYNNGGSFGGNSLLTYNGYALYAPNATLQYQRTTSPNAIPANVMYYVPITISNPSASSTPGNFQQVVSLDPLAICNAITCANHLNNTEFFYGNNGTVMNSWYEFGAGQPNNYGSNTFSTSSNVIAWVLISPNGYINAFGSNMIYLGFLANSVNNFNALGKTGEAPALTATYAKYDNGNNIFTFYTSGLSNTGWTTASAAGHTNSGPAGSPFGTNTLYANGGSTDYQYINAGLKQNGNYIIQYYFYTQVLGDFFFLTNSGGAGQLTRQDGRGGQSSGLATTTSWTGWDGPASGVSIPGSNWYMMEIDSVGGTSVANLYSTTLNYEGALTTINPLSTTYPDSSGTETYSPKGGYIGLQGDGGGGVTYLNGLMVRIYPPGGVMPSTQQGSLVPSGGVIIETIYGTLNAGQVNTQNIKITKGAQSGYVLTSDSAGDGTWQAPAPPTMVTGNYTGNGGSTQSITGIGLQPIYLVIYNQGDQQGSGTYLATCQATNMDGGNAYCSYNDSVLAYQEYSSVYEGGQIDSLDSNGFTVDGNGGSYTGLNLMNINGDVYTYIAWSG